MEVLNSCHCCLRGAPIMELTKPYTHLGKTEIYSDMLKECFDLQLALDSDGSCGICLECVGRLRDASDFKLQVQRSQAKLQARLQEAVHVKEEPAVESGIEDDSHGGKPLLYAEPSVKMEMENENETSDEENLDVERAIKAEEFDNAASEEESISLASDDAPDPVSDLARLVSDRTKEQLAMTCCVRLERLRSFPALRASQPAPATTHRERATDVQQAPSQACSCDTCGQHFTDKSALIKHMQDHVTIKNEINEKYFCAICFKYFPCGKSFLTHKQIHSDKNNLYFCDMCNENFRAKHILIKHIRKHMGWKGHVCQICNKSFVTDSHLRQHVIIHIGKKPFSCNECYKQFVKESDLNAHKRIHTGEKPFGYDDCHKRLTDHQIAHTKEKPFACDVCTKAFTCSSKLQKHRRMHTGEKPYTCGECNRQYAHIQRLKIHERVHTGERPFGCEECNKQFIDKSDLTRHKKIHIGDKPFKCDICVSSFLSKGGLARHIMTHMVRKS